MACKSFLKCQKDQPDLTNNVIFLKQNHQDHEFVSRPLLYVSLTLGPWFNVKPHFPIRSLLVFFINKCNSLKEGEKETLTSESHVLLYFDQLLLIVK